MRATSSDIGRAGPPHAPTTIYFWAFERDGSRGYVPHQYAFASRNLAGRFARFHVAKGHVDGFELETPGYVPPERPPLIPLDELPF